MQYECLDRHFISLERFSLFFHYYAFVDTDEYLADQLFIREKVQVRFGREAHRADSKYCIIFCKIKKRDEKAFLTALQKLPSKMFLCGYTDYLDFCCEFQKIIQKCEGEEHLYEQSCSAEKAK